MSQGRLILVRHGESTGNIEQRFSSDPHIDLTERGAEQARTTGRAIRERFAPRQIVASPYHRARRTAVLIAAELEGAMPITIAEDLRERSIGDLAGKPYRAMREHADYSVKRYWAWRPPNGESLEDVQARAGRILEQLAAAYPGNDTVVVSHGGTMLALCAHVEGGFERPRVAGNCEIVVVEHSPGGGFSLVDAATVGGAAGAEAEETGG
jgi:broad specificity phosphatase PhoE